MHVMVCGAGVIGITTAYYLAKLGHEVTVVDRRDGPAEETSFANGGQISPSHVDPWASPQNLKRIVGWIGRDNAPLLYRLRFDPALWDWTVRFLINCTAAKQRRNTERMLRVALHSVTKLRELRAELNLDYGPRENGILHIFRSQSAFDQARRQAELVSELGCPRLPITPAECVALEPALAGSADTLVGGFHCPDDETGDAHRFTKALAKACEEMGVRFYYDVSIAEVNRREKRATDIKTTRGPFRADNFVIALGSYTGLITKRANVPLPLYPAKGYSATLPITDAAKAPRLGIIDDERKHVYSRLGDNLRVAGMAEIAGFDTYVERKRASHLVESAQSLFPAATEAAGAELWAGLRPQTPDSVPLIGRTRIENVYVNTGHGPLGWTMACGSGDLMASIVCARPPAVEVRDLGPDRFIG